MAQDEGKQEEEKFDFTREGEVSGYISLDQARVRAMRTARETPGVYGSSFTDVAMAFEVVEAEETEDHHVITLSFRPQGEFAGRAGQEQFFIEKEGNVALRQVLALPRRRRRFPVAPVTIGLVVVAGVAALATVFVVSGMGDGGPEESASAAVLPPAIPIPTMMTPLPAPTEAPGIAPPVDVTPTPIPIPTAPPPPTLTPTPTTAPTLIPTPMLVPTVNPDVNPTPVLTNTLCFGPQDVTPYVNRVESIYVSRQTAGTLPELAADLMNQLPHLPRGNPQGVCDLLDQVMVLLDAEQTASPVPTLVQNDSTEIRSLLLYGDDFSDPNSGWRSGVFGSFEARYTDGEYHILLNEVRTVGGDVARPIFTDFDIQVKARYEGGN